MKKWISTIIAIFFCVISTYSQVLAPKGIRVGKKASTKVGVVDSIATHGGKLKVYRGATLLSPVTADSLKATDYLVFKADSNYQKPGSYTSRYDFKNEYMNSNLIKGFNELGFGIKYLPFAEFGLVSGNALIDGRQYFTAVRITDTTLLTGVKFVLSVAGDYTGDQTNSFALYKWNGTSFDKEAETTNDLNIWKATANTLTTKAFASTYTAVPGWYYVALIYNSSAQVTAPNFYSMGISQNWFSEIGTFKLCA